MKTRDLLATLSLVSVLSLSLTACNSGDSSLPTAPPPTPGIAVSTTTLSTSEDGTEASFAVVLNTKPSSDVSLTFTSRDTTEGYIGSDTDVDWDWDYFADTVDLDFTPSNWNVPQVIKVQGVDDSEIDGNQTYSVANTWVWSMDLDYVGVSQPTVSVTNIDTSAPGVTVSTTNLSTTENSGTAWFSVKLNIAPTAPVNIPLTISDTTEGTFDCYGNVPTITVILDQTNWYYGRSLYVCGVDDVIADGNQTYDITVGTTTSTDTGYDGLSGDTISVTNNDNDTAAYTVSAVNPLRTAEWGQNASFTVVLNTEPTADVVIPVSSPDSSEGLVSSLATPALASSVDLTFTTANWNIAQTVTVTGQDDADLDGDASYNLTVGAPTGASEYTTLSTQSVAVVNVDDDTARVDIQGADLQVTEGAGTDTFVVSLAKEPVGDVIINVTSNDTTEALVKGGNSLTPVDAIVLSFNAANWTTAQTVTVVGQDDLEIDGNQSLTIGVAIDTGLTSDTDYNALSAQAVSVTNADNDVAGMTVTSGTLYIYESGTTDTFTVKLNTIPTADVTVPVAVEDSNEFLIESGASGQVASLNLTFTPTDWATPQTVTVHAIDDFLDENSEYYDVTVGAASSADTDYNGLAAITRSVYLYDNDTAGFVITPSTGLSTSEDGLSYDFTVKLVTEPTGNAFVNVSSGNVAEGLLTAGAVVTPTSAVTLEFTPSNWQTAQTVTVHGQDDALLDGPITYDITVDDISGYTASAKTATVTNSDNEVGVSETVSLAIAGLPYDGQVAPASISTYSMSLSAGWKYTVTADNVTDDISLTVKDSSGTTTLCSSSKTGVKTAEFCAFVTPADGAVDIVIDGAATTNGAGFTLSLAEPLYPVTFEAYGFDSRYLELYDADILTNPSEYRLAYSYDAASGSASFAYDLVAGQTYYLKVYAYYSDDIGAYKIQATKSAVSLGDYGSAVDDTAGEPGDDAASGAVALSLETPLERYLSSGDTDWFKFTVPNP